MLQDDCRMIAGCNEHSCRVMLALHHGLLAHTICCDTVTPLQQLNWGTQHLGLTQGGTRHARQAAQAVAMGHAHNRRSFSYRRHLGETSSCPNSSSTSTVVDRHRELMVCVPLLWAGHQRDI